MKQTPVCVLCDWFISNSTSKDDVERWMSKDSRYARNTERGYNMRTIKIVPRPIMLWFLFFSSIPCCASSLVHPDGWPDASP